MKRLLTRTVSIILLTFPLMMLASLTACLGTGNDEAQTGPDLVVFVTDSAGAPLGADTVTWSYYGDEGTVHHKVAHGDDSTHKPLSRLDAEGTKWGVSDENLHASVFVRARFHRTLEDELCMIHGYAVQEINADKLPQEVTLVLDIAEVCE